jgi:S-disulfanyl-L-cysteine oxidoreductase SoxD
MFSCREIARGCVGAFVGAALAGSALAAQAQAAPYPGIGRAATASELAAWDIDVRPDFKGLPKGSGSVARGMQVWEAQCASCHGVFGESNEVFSPIVGGTTKGDIGTGRVARLTDRNFPGRTTLMKLSTLSTLWDYINRAMPWAAPKSLTTDEVYAVTAYVLSLAAVVPDDFVLSDSNIAEVQKRLPNRNGVTTEHALWPGSRSARADVRAVACMKDCGPEPQVTSSLPDFARNAHGNLAEQNRSVGAQRGVDTGKPLPGSSTPAVENASAAAIALTQKFGCVACHAMDSKVVGPGFAELAQKYAGRADAADHLAGKIRAGGSGVWGAIPMPPQNVSEADAKTIARWLAEGAKK